MMIGDRHGEIPLAAVLDIPFARKVLEFAEQKHEGFQHAQVLFYADEESYDMECGTAACLAGIAAMLSPNATFIKSDFIPSPGHVPDGRFYRNVVGVNIDGEEYAWDEAAAKLLGLSAEQAQLIFWEMSNEDALCKFRAVIEQAEQDQYAECVDSPDFHGSFAPR